MPDLAAFDFDGTLTTNDNFTSFLLYALDARRLAIGKVVLSPLIAAYKLGLVPASSVRKSVVRFGFAGSSESEVRQRGLEYSREALPVVLRSEMMERIRWHKDRGNTVVVVSASLDVYLADWCKLHGLDLICTELEARQGVLTGRYRNGDCAGEEKARRVRRRYDLGEFGRVFAYGDSKEDFALLRLAHSKFFQGREVSVIPS